MNMLDRRIAKRRWFGHIVLVLPLCLTMTTRAMAEPPPAGVTADEWHALEAELRSEVGLPPETSHRAEQEATAKGGITAAHGLVRTDVLLGDYSGLPAQSSGGPEFGFSVASDGDWLAVGAPGTVWTHASHGTASHGAVFIFHRPASGGWTLHQRILMTNSPNGPRCGHTVALKMPYVAFGCPDTDNASGTQLPGWTRVWRQATTMGQFTPSSSHAGYGNGRCGSSLALTSNYLAVGCPTALRASDQIETGSVSVYRRNATTGVFAIEELLEPAGNHPGARFGHAVAMYESTSPGVPPFTVRLAIGTPNRIYTGDIWPSGSVYLYSRPLDTANWTQTIEFNLAGASNYTLSGFGQAVAMNRTQIVVGAPNRAAGGIGLPGPGTVHRYQYNTILGWTAMDSSNGVNLPSGIHGGMRFGDAVAIGFDNFIAIGAPRTDGSHSGGGIADEVGLVEVRRAGDGGYAVNSYRGEMRPGPLGVLSLAEGHFGRSLEFDSAARRMVVGYPRAGVLVSGRRGQVWIYQTDQIFANGFQNP